MQLTLFKRLMAAKPATEFPQLKLSPRPGRAGKALTAWRQTKTARATKERMVKGFL
jgi:hypothetical protein